MNSKYNDFDWETKLEELINLAHLEEKAAVLMGERLIEPVTEKYGAAGREMMYLKYQLGIINMLINEYDAAEIYLLEAMELAEHLGGSVAEMFATITKYLSILYEAKGREDLY